MPRTMYGILDLPCLFKGCFASLFLIIFFLLVSGAQYSFYYSCLASLWDAFEAQLRCSL